MSKYLNDIEKVEKINWTSECKYMDNIKMNYNSFLHVKGQSRFKQTQVLLDLWIKHPDWPMLTITHYGNCNLNGYLDIKVPIKIHENITIYQHKMTKTMLSILMNQNGCHICPSFIEGFGHYINEARSCGAVVITPNCPPMNEFINNNGILIQTNNIKKYNLGLYCTISEEDLEQAILEYLNLSFFDRKEMGNNSKKMFEKQNELFFSQKLIL